ncbi:MAG: DUF554 domain-containing protein [Desulfovibrio sp.]|nr:DUF554 domain-containing protein [Desulfovibrio sp.]
MTGLGTLINAAGIVLGGLAGLACGKALSSRFQDILVAACGVSTLFIGLGGALEKSLVPTADGLRLTGALMVVGSFALGSFLGELVNIHAGLERFGRWLRRKSGSEGDSNFVNAFLTASFTVCIGAMAIVGSIADGLSGDISVLSLKAILDFVIIMVMTAALGKGCIFSAIPVAVLQLSVTWLAAFIGPALTPQMLHNLSLTGSLLIFCVGVNLLWKLAIRVANMLPALLVAMFWACFA